MTKALIQFSSVSNIDFIVRAWAAAAGTAGSPVPLAVATELLRRRDGDVVRAALVGTAVAEAACPPSDPCRPRGVDIRVRGGVATDLVWHSDTHEVMLRAIPDRDGVVTWHLRVIGDERSHRLIAAIATAWSWRDGDVEHQQVLDAAAQSGLVVADDGLDADLLIAELPERALASLRDAQDLVVSS